MSLAGADPTGPDTTCLARCSEGERVREGACVPCLDGLTNASGDIPTGPNTACHPSDACFEAFKVVCEEFEEAYIKASNTDAGDEFGRSIAVSRDGLTLVVGARLEDSRAIDGDQEDNRALEAGAVYVYVRTGSTWRQQAYIKGSNTGTGDIFGFSVALSSDGSTLAVGAPGEDSTATGIGGDQGDSPMGDASGAVYLFSREGAVWQEQAYIKASNSQAQDAFGWSVSINGVGDALAVGAIGEGSAARGVDGDEENNSMPGAGAVFVFERAEGVWGQQAYLKASNPDAADRFGASVALSRDGDILAVVSATEDSNATGVDGDQDNNLAEDSGAVYLFRRSDDAWMQSSYIKASNTDPDDRFGSGVALSDDGQTLVAGAFSEDSAARGLGGNENDDSARDSGAVYVFDGQGGAWSQEAYVKASNTGRGDSFGFSVTLSGDGSTFAVGADREGSASLGVNGSEDDDRAFASGAVYVFGRVGGAWQQRGYVKSSNSEAGDVFGHAVALSEDGSVLAAVALGEDSAARGVNGDPGNGAENSGAAFVRRLSQEGI
ncbi:MAG: integrin [Myxococcota bacterium]